MANKPATFRQADVTRAFKGAKAAEFVVSRMEIEGAKIVLYGKGREDEPKISVLDTWRSTSGSL